MAGQTPCPRGRCPRRTGRARPVLLAWTSLGVSAALVGPGVHTNDPAGLDLHGRKGSLRRKWGISGQRNRQQVCFSGEPLGIDFCLIGSREQRQELISGRPCGP